jgi:hypothetical protein
MATNQALVEALYSQLFGGGLITSGLYGGSSSLLPGGLGLRTVRAAAADPQAAWQTLFTIAGGVIAITAFVGVRTVIQAGGASTIQFRHSVGPTVSDNGTAIITGDTVGTMYTITGDPNDPVVIGLGGNGISPSKIIATSATYGSPILGYAMPGNLQVTMTAAAGTGSTRYVLCWIPIDAAATVVAA